MCSAKVAGKTPPPSCAACVFCLEVLLQVSFNEKKTQQLDEPVICQAGSVDSQKLI